jgi:tetratricopeptide (TPR) repeat protein
MAPQKHTASAMEIDRLATQLAKDPRSKVFLPLAEAYCKVGMWEEAVGVLEDGLKYYPAFITAMVVLGCAYDQLSRPAKARAVLEGAVKLSPDNLRAHRTLTKIYAAQGLTEEALRSCRVILGMNPRDEEAGSVQASLLQKLAQATNTTTSNRSPVPYETDQAPVLPSEPVMVTDSADSSVLAECIASSIEPITRPTTHDVEPKTAAGRKQAGGQAAIIAELESWLESLNRHRRDGRTTNSADSIP